MSSELKIAFLTSLGVNVGDEFIREGILAMLDRLNVPYTPLYVNKVDPSSIGQPREDETQVVSDKYWQSDLFIQAGAPVYWHLFNGKSTSLTSDWHQWMWQDRILNESRKYPAFINLGAGSCQPWGDGGEAFLNDAECVKFAVAAAARSLLTTVRDPVASEILSSLSMPHKALPCPAFYAAERHNIERQTYQLIGINLMPLGAHYDLREDFDRNSWQITCFKLVTVLRRLSKIVFICHDVHEKNFAEMFAAPDERIFYSTCWRDFFDIYSACRLVIANRVHGAVCAAGFGVPSLILGNDTRARIGDYIGLESYQSGQVDHEFIFEKAIALHNSWRTEHDRLLSLRHESFRKYQELLKSIIEQLIEDKSTFKKLTLVSSAGVALASATELDSQSFKGFIHNINMFAERNNLRTFTNWSKVWEYPWLWFHCLSEIDWRNKRLLDLGSEISPMPWFLASLGAKVTLVEADKQWIPHWERLQKEMGFSVDWHIVSDETLPLNDNSFDVVTSFSVIEHQKNKLRAVDEVARVLKKGGLFGLSFDICEPSMGMTFPEWNGRALTMSEFEKLIWAHPAFDNGGRVPHWNLNDSPEFIKWHLQSAPHHNYIVGAAFLNKR